VGELLLGGDQLMRGYWGRPAEDAKAFIELAGERYYRTGDYAFVDAHGNYQYVGRRDDEIKLNGYRIHLNEVQRCVADEPRVEAAVAAVISDHRGERVLGTAIVTSAPVDQELAAAIQKHVGSLLPGPMQPRRWAFFNAFPRLASGKIDREACFARLSRAIATADARFYKQTGDELQPLVST
jgi:acyl-coenzyme A synthetase/AMP-(fatty) acid ligase